MMPEIIICPGCACYLTWANTPDCHWCQVERWAFWQAAAARLRRKA